MYTLSTEKKLAVLSGLVEGNSLRSISRMTGVDRNTITSLLLKTGDQCADLMDGSMQSSVCGDIILLRREDPSRIRQKRF